MSAFPPIPPGTDLQADQGPRVISASIALIVLPTIFLILRFLSRKLARAGIWWDDVLMIAALIFSYGAGISVIVSVRTNGFGKHLWALPNSALNTSQFLKILYIYVICYYIAVVCIKLAILTFYRRIFPVAQLKLPLFFGCGVVIAFGVATVLAEIFSCQPIHGFWQKQVPAQCINEDRFLLVTGSLNAAFDILIIALPIPLLWKLRTTTGQKTVLTAIFACASFVCIISIIRVRVLARLTHFDVTWNYVNAAIWSLAEPCMGVIAACLPSLRPLLAIIWRGTHRGPTLDIHGKSVPNTTTSTSSSRIMWSRRDKTGDELDGQQMDSRGFARLDDRSPGPRCGHDVHVQGGREPKKKKSIPGGDRGLEAGDDADQISLEEMVPKGAIKVKSEVLITTSDWEYRDRIF